MNVETKYDAGQKLFAMHENKPQEVFVLEAVVKTKVSFLDDIGMSYNDLLEQGKWDVTTTVDYKVATLDNVYGSWTISEGELFVTKDDLIESLR